MAAGGRHDLVIDFLSGSLGATASTYVGQPLDTLKVKMQTFPKLYPSLAVCAHKTIKNEGVSGLYRGTVPALAAIVAENSLLFMAYGATQRAMARAVGVEEVSQLGLLSQGLCGGMAAFWPSLVLCPMELVKCRLQALQESSLASGKPPLQESSLASGKPPLQESSLASGKPPLQESSLASGKPPLQESSLASGKPPLQESSLAAGKPPLQESSLAYGKPPLQENSLPSGKPPPRLGAWSLAKNILRSEGLPGLYRGLTATFTREMPGYFCFFLAYEATRSSLTPAGSPVADLGPLGTLVSGAVAGVTLWTVIFPADVVKSRLAVSGATTPMVTMLRTIARTEGPAALYSGLLPTLLRTVPATATLLLVVENSKTLLSTLLH